MAEQQRNVRIGHLDMGGMSEKKAKLHGLLEDKQRIEGELVVRWQK